MIDLRQGNCLEIMKTIQDNSIDLVVIDPPYQLQKGGTGAFGTTKRKYRSEYTIFSDGFNLKILDELQRLMKKTNIYIWCSKAQLSKIIRYYEKINCNIDVLTWHKSNPTPACNNTYLSDTEYLIFAREKGVKLYGTYETKRKYYITPTNKQDKKLYKHPTVKPLHIIKNLIINSSNENDVVLDCFMGSGTTGVACKELNRNFIGIEINKKFYEIAKERIENYERSFFIGGKNANN